MAITSQAELQVRARLAEVARQQRAADLTLWAGWIETENLTPGAGARPNSRSGGAVETAAGVNPAASRAPRGWERARWLLGVALIRLGAVIAGPALPPLPPGAPPHHA